MPSPCSVADFGIPNRGRSQPVDTSATTLTTAAACQRTLGDIARDGSAAMRADQARRPMSDWCTVYITRSRDNGVR